MSKLNAGWGFPLRANVPHYFQEGSIVSLCGKWMFSGHRELENHEGDSNDCKACIRKLTKIKGYKK